jgi:hypothetical protein
MDIVFTFVRTSEELLLGVADFETTIDQISRVCVGSGGIVARGEPTKWDSHEKDIIAAMNRTGAELVQLEGEEMDGSKWVKTFKKNKDGKAELIGCEKDASV